MRKDVVGMKNKKLKIVFTVLIVAFVLGVATLLSVLIVNSYVVNVTKDSIITAEEAASYNADCILVLGAGVREDGTPNHMLRDRLNTGVSLYISGASDRMIMSGDHSRKDYDEVNVMKNFAIEKGIPSNAIFMDHAGFSTYDSMYRAKEIFGVEKMVIVTQEYHLYRALYIAKKLGIDAVGVSTDKNIVYRGQELRDLREIAARYKDFFYTVFKPEPTYMGESIPVSGDGDITNDR